MRVRRFGFVRFFDVGNVEGLQKELDAITIGNQKIHVNLVRFRRTHSETNKKRYTQNQRASRVSKVWRRRETPQTYAQTVKRQNLSANSTGAWMGMDINTEVSNKE